MMNAPSALSSESEQIVSKPSEESPADASETQAIGFAIDPALAALDTHPTSSSPLPLKAPTPAPVNHESSAPVSPVVTVPVLPPPPDAATAADAAQPTAAQERPPLNVTDALSYLDSVKNQFHAEPEVYNQFLEIMKDFKSHAIDTPGVIQRVSHLFHGNPGLIQGFNTFLPPGYRIEMSTDPSKPNVITVTTPSGATTHMTNNFHSTPALSGNGQPDYTWGVGATSENGGPADALDATSTQEASLLRNLDHGPVVTQKPESYGEALDYLHRIRNRYPDDQKKYQAFTDILTGFHQAKKPFQDSNISAQVKELFKDAPDLYQEWEEIFLPNANRSQISKSDKNRRATPSQQKRRKEPVAPIPPPKRPNNSAQANARNKKAKTSHKAESESYNSYNPNPPSPQFAQAHATNSHHGHHHQQSHWANAVLPPPPPLPLPSTRYNAGTTAGPEELSFFERAKRYIDNLDHYEDFLKLLRLYSQDVITEVVLLEALEPFIGDGELMHQFKILLKWEARDIGPPGSKRTAAPEALPSHGDGSAGYSYRRLSDKEAHLACSGRDQHCRSLLNDIWVSHPTWASEDSGFVTHKKNIYEDHLHKVEEERHEYAVHLTGLAATIALLDPILERIQEMTSDEQAAFRLAPNFGGPGKELYHRVIKKVYGKEAGLEMIQSLQDSPAIAVPIVLHTLSEIDARWRQVGREWGRGWRDIDAKNFYRSLDHQGLIFKTNEKKALTSKHLVSEIETEARKREKSAAYPGAPYGSTGFQLSYTFEDRGVLHDTCNMILSFLDSPSGTQVFSPNLNPDKAALESFLREFVPLICKLTEADFTAACEGRSTSDGHDDHSPDKLTNGIEAEASSPSPSKESPEEIEDLPVTDDQQPWISETSPAQEDDAPNVPFFANTHLYALLRLIQGLYSRLAACKEAGAQLAKSGYKAIEPNPIALELGLDDPEGPLSTLTQAIEAVGLQDDASLNIPYMYFLETCERVFDGELPIAKFEEHTRWVFGHHAYLVYTLDRYLPGVIKQVSTCKTERKCDTLLSLYKSMRKIDRPTNQDIIRYRRLAEMNCTADDHLYRVEWDQANVLKIQLLNTEDPSLDDTDITPERRWRQYVDSYVLKTTEWLPQPKDSASAVFLPRSTSFYPEEASEAVTDSGATVIERIGIRLTPRTYKILYNAGTEDVIVRRRPMTDWELLDERARRREDERINSRFAKSVFV